MQTKHSKLSDKNREFFAKKEQNLKKQRVDSVSCPFMCTLKQASLDSCVVSWHIARTKKPHSIGETLIKTATEMVHIMCGGHVANKLDVVPLSNDAVHRRIASMSANVKNCFLL